MELDYNTAPLAEIKAAVLEDGVLDAEEVSAIKTRLLADGVIDREEANFLFELNDAVSGKDNDPSWTAFFVEAITSHVLEDDETPNVLDADEWSWLQEQIDGDGQVDATEKALLENIQATATEVPDTFSTYIQSQTAVA